MRPVDFLAGTPHTLNFSTFMTSTNANDLSRRIAGGSAKLATLGLGCVGLPLSVEFASSGVDVLGIDIDAEKVSAVSRGESYIRDVPSQRLPAAGRGGGGAGPA